MWVTRTFCSKFDYGEMVVFDNECSTRHNQACEIIKVDDVGGVSPLWVYDVRFADGFTMCCVQQYDLRNPTVAEMKYYVPKLFKPDQAYHCKPTENGKVVQP